MVKYLLSIFLDMPTRDPIRYPKYTKYFVYIRYIWIFRIYVFGIRDIFLTFRIEFSVIVSSFKENFKKIKIYFTYSYNFGIWIISDICLGFWVFVWILSVFLVFGYFGFLVPKYRHRTGPDTYPITCILQVFKLSEIIPTRKKLIRTQTKKI